MNGTVVRTGRDFGVIRAENGTEYRFQTAELQRGLRLQNNNPVTFELADDGHGGQKAIQVRKTQQQQPLAVSFNFSEPVRAGEHYALMVTVNAKRGKDFASGVGIELTGNGQPMERPTARPFTDGHGNAKFSVVVRTADETSFCATVDNKKYTEIWTPPKPELKVEVIEGPESDTFVVSYGFKDYTMPCDLEIFLTTGCVVAWRDDSTNRWKTATRKFTLPSTGRTVFFVKIDKALPGVSGEDIFVGVKGTTWKSDTFYVSGRR